MQRGLARVLLVLGLLCLTVGTFLDVRRSAFRSMSYGNLKCLGTAFLMYAEDHGGQMPPMQSTEAARKALAPYADSLGEDLWQVPGQPGVFYQPNPALSRRKIDSIEDLNQTILLYEPSEYLSPAYGRRVAYADGHAQFVTSEAWARVAGKSGVRQPAANQKDVYWEPVIVRGAVRVGEELLTIALLLAVASMLTRKQK